MTQKALSQALGCTQGHVCHIENSGRGLSLESTHRILSFLGKSFIDLEYELRLGECNEKANLKTIEKENTGT